MEDFNTFLKKFQTPRDGDIWVQAIDPEPTKSGCRWSIFELRNGEWQILHPSVSQGFLGNFLRAYHRYDFGLGSFEGYYHQGERIYTSG